MTDKRYLENADTGERIWLNPEKNAWEPAPILTNQDTGEKIQLWNDQWVPIQKPKTAVQQMREIEAEDVPIPPMRQEGRPEIQDSAIGIKTRIDPMQKEILRREGIEYDKPSGYKPGTGIEPVGSTQYMEAPARLPLGKKATKTQQQEAVKRERLQERDIEESLGDRKAGGFERFVGSVTNGIYSVVGPMGEMLTDYLVDPVVRGGNAAFFKILSKSQGSDTPEGKVWGDIAKSLYEGKGEAYESTLVGKLRKSQREAKEEISLQGIQSKPLFEQGEDGKMRVDWEAFKDPKFYAKITVENAPQLAMTAMSGAKAFSSVITAGGTEAQAISAAAKTAGSVESAQIFTQTYQEARERGMDQAKALGAASIAAGIGFAVSRGLPGFSGLVSKAKGKGKIVEAGARLVEEGFEGAFFRNAAKSPSLLKRVPAQALTEMGEETLQTGGEIAGIGLGEGKVNTQEAIGKLAAGAAGGFALGGLAGGVFGPKQLFGKSRSDVAMEAIIASGGKHENLAPVETRVANVRQAIESAQRDLDTILALDETERTEAMNKRAQVLQQQIAGMESAIAGLEAEATTTEAGKAIAPVATASQEGINAEQALQKGEAILESIEDPSNKLKGEIENLRLEADLAALEVQNLERDLAPVIRGSQTQYASDEEIEAGKRAERDLVAARRNRDQVLKSVSKRLNGLINPMAEKEYAAALKDGRLVPPAPIEVPESVEPVSIPFATVSVRTDAGVERVDLTGALAREYQDEEANHNQMVQDIRGSRMTSEERARALREEGDRFQSIKLDLIERSKSETPTMAQEVQDVDAGTAQPVAPVVEQQPTTGQLPGEDVGLDEAAGAVGPEAGVSDVNATEEGLALTSRLFPKELERIQEAVERGGKFERSTDLNGNEVLTLRTQRTFTGYPAYWQMTRVGDGAVMIDVVIFPDGEAHIAYTEAQGVSGAGRKAIKNAVVTALADGQNIDRVTGQTIVVQSFINRARYNGSTWNPSNSTMTTPVESILNDDLLVDFDYDLAARALSEAQAQHVESSQDAFERSRGGVSDVGTIEFDPFENTKKAISEAMRTANAFGAQSIYEITVALVKDLARIGNVTYGAFKQRLGDLLGPDRFVQFMRSAGGDLELVNLFKQVRVEVVKAAGTVLNPMSTVDVKLAEAGVRTLTERLGFEKDDHPEDRVMAVKRAIGGLGSSQQETAIKVMEAFDGVTPSIAKEIASIIHTYRRSDQKTPSESAKTDDTDYFAQAKKIMDDEIAAELTELQSGDSKSTKTAKRGADRTFQTTVPSDMSLHGRQLSEQDRQSLAGSTSSKSLDREMLRIFPRIRIEGRKIKLVQPLTGATWMGGITSPAQYMWRSQPMRIIRRTLAKFVADIQSIKRSASEELQALLRVARDPMQNQLVGLALGLASYRPYKSGDEIRYGMPFSKEELKLLFPEMTQDAIDAYFAVTQRMQVLKSDTIASITNAYESKKRIAEAKLNNPETSGDGKRAIRKNLDELNQAYSETIGTLRSNNAYWPSMRFGNFIWRAYDSEGNQLLTVFTENDGEEGKVEALDRLKMAALQSQKVADAIKNRNFQWNILSNGDPVASPKLDESIKGEGGLIFDLSTAKWLTSAKQLDGELGLNDDLGTALELAIDASYLRDTMKAHEQMRLGVPGWETDAVKVFQTYLSTTANFIANNNNQKAISDAMTALNSNTSLDPKLRTEAQKQVKTVKHPPILPQWGQVALTSGFVMQMGLVASAGVQQLLQIPTVVWVSLSNFYGAVETSKSLMAGIRAAFALLDYTNVEDFQGKTFDYIQKRINQVITPEKLKWVVGEKDLNLITETVRSAIFEAFKSGSLQPKMTSEMLQAESAPGLGSRIADAGVEYLGIIMTKMERINRMQTIIGAAILAAKHGTMVTHGKDGGWSLAKQDLSTEAGVSEVVSNAEEFNAATNFVGGRGDLAPYQRVGGNAGVPVRLLFQFTRFGLDYITLMHSLGLTNYRQASAQGKSAIRAYMKPHLRAFITMSLLAGPSSYYVVNWLMAIMKMFMGDDAEELMQDARDSVQDKVKIIAATMTDDEQKAESIANKMTFALEEGLPNAAGVNLHNTLKWQMILGDRDDGLLTILGKKMAGPFLGPVVTGVESALGADATLTKTAKSKLTPRAAKNLGRAIEGKVEVGGKEFDYNWLERVAKAGSFSTTEESMLYQQANRKYTADRSRDAKVKRLREKNREAQEYTRIIRDPASTPAQKDEAAKARASLRRELKLEAREWNEKFKELKKVVRPIEDRDWQWSGKLNEKLGEWAGKEAGIDG